MFYINRGKVKADGTTAIMYRITIDGKNSVITTGLYCKPEDWSSKKGMVKEDRTNRRLSQYRQDIQKKYGELLKRNGVVSAELLKNAITGVNELPVLLLRSGEVEREKLKIRAKDHIAPFSLILTVKCPKTAVTSGRIHNGCQLTYCAFFL